MKGCPFVFRIQCHTEEVIGITAKLHLLTATTTAKHHESVFSGDKRDYGKTLFVK